MSECWNYQEQLAHFGPLLGELLEQWKNERRVCRRGPESLGVFVCDAAHEHHLPAWIGEVLRKRIQRVEEIGMGFARLHESSNQPTVF